jgi:hypothetical protein
LVTGNLYLLFPVTPQSGAGSATCNLKPVFPRNRQLANRELVTKRIYRYKSTKLSLLFTISVADLIQIISF